MQKTNKRDSIYLQLLRLLIISAVAAAVFLVCMTAGVDILIDKYIYNSDYKERKNQQYADAFQVYVDEKNLGFTDVDEIDQWIREQKIIAMRIYKDGIIIFDSAYPNEDIWEEEISVTDYAWTVYYPIEFADGEGQLSIMGAYVYQIYNYTSMLELLLAFALFLFLVLAGIRKKMNYIRTLSHEIEILEGGSLDYQVTVKGKDELAALAVGLENMRNSFKHLIEQEARITRENQRMITEMSHDLRTPVTSVILYTEILKSGKFKDQNQWYDYVEKIHKKAQRMKQLTENLFEYSLVTGDNTIQLEPPETLEILFYDLFSETSGYLEQKGFNVMFHGDWESIKIRISTEYLMRIMDNITSNIIKYAQSEKPVCITFIREGMFCGFKFENHIRRLNERPESTGIGLQSIKSMMLKMNGKVITKTEGNVFCLSILFPVV